MSVLRALGDDIDDAVYRVCAPDRAAGSANYLNSLDILQQDVLEFPINAREQRGVNAPAVNQHQHGFRELTSESTDTHGPVVRVYLRHFHAWHHSENFGHACRSGAANILLGNYIDRRRSVPDFLRFFRGGCDFHRAKLFQAQLFQIIGRILIVLCGLGPTVLHQSHE